MRSAAQTSLVVLALLAAMHTVAAGRPEPLAGAVEANGVRSSVIGDAEHMRALLASASSIMFDSAFGEDDSGFYTTSWGRLEKSSLGVAEPTSFSQKRSLLSAREITEADWP